MELGTLVHPTHETTIEIMKRIFILMALVLVMGHTTNNELREITGKVVSARSGAALAGVNIEVLETGATTITNQKGEFSAWVPSGIARLKLMYLGFSSKEVTVTTETWIEVQLEMETVEIDLDMEIVEESRAVKTKGWKKDHAGQATYFFSPSPIHPGPDSYQDWNTEEYATIHENIFLDPHKKPLSTFSIDVDAASYSNIRRFINNGQRPPIDAVRIEEMVNYFNYDYQQPPEDTPFSITTELSSAPWNESHTLLHIGLQGRKIPVKDLPPSNLVFLLDVSGSMNSANKLPLLKSSFKLLVEQLRPEDHVAIVVYAGAAGLVLPPTSGAEKSTIMSSLDRLSAGGSTAGGAGIRLAYDVAKKHFNPQGNNRIILATDGDFNIGESSNASMERLIESKRDQGIFLTVLGFGMGNYKDSKMEILADKGNGNYAYIDTMKEAKKVLQTEFGGTMFTIAKDVKIQIEFNPKTVQAYRLIGYENRALRDEDFNNDKKDAGDLGSGHTVTALYEIVPVGVDSEVLGSIDELKYQSNKIVRSASKSGELATLKLRYKEPLGAISKLQSHIVQDEAVAWSATTNNFRWSASVASFGMILRDSQYKGTATRTSILEWARSSMGKDPFGYRHEFLQLVETSTVVASR